MSESLSAFFYLVAAICFIMGLRGLSSPETARAGNIYGIAGMVIAVVTTLATPHVVSLWLIVVGILIGGAIGTYIALRIQMTALPQLVAAFHSLVGLAAVCVAAAAFTFPEAYGIGVRGSIHRSSLIEMAIGMAIGAITLRRRGGGSGLRAERRSDLRDQNGWQRGAAAVGCCLDQPERRLDERCSDARFL